VSTGDIYTDRISGYLSIMDEFVTESEKLKAKGNLNEAQFCADEAAEALKYAKALMEEMAP
jgi:hypothetical protein